MFGRLVVVYKAKYDWGFVVVSGGLKPADRPPARVFRVAPVTTFGFGRGGIFSQTR